jgi:hypothetical protein
MDSVIIPHTQVAVWRLGNTEVKIFVAVCGKRENLDQSIGKLHRQKRGKICVMQWSITSMLVICGKYQHVSNIIITLFGLETCMHVYKTILPCKMHCHSWELMAHACNPSSWEAEMVDWDSTSVPAKVYQTPSQSIPECGSMCLSF